MADFHLDFKPVFGDATEGLRYLGNALSESRAFAEKRRLDDLREKRDEANIKYNEDIAKTNARRLDMQDRIALNQEEHRQAQENLASGKTLRSMLGQSRESEAMQIAAATKTIDPVTGETRGIDVQKAGLPDEPPPLEAAPQHAENVAFARFLGVGKRPEPQIQPGDSLEPPKLDETTHTPGFVPNVPAEHMTMEQDNPEADKLAGNLDVVDEYQQAQDRDAAMKTRAAGQKYTIRYGKGSPETFDPSEQHHAEQLQRNEDADMLMQAAARLPNTADGDRQREIFMRNAELLRAKATGAMTAASNNAESQQDAQSFTGGESAKYKLTAEQQMELGKEKAKHAGGGGLGAARLEVTKANANKSDLNSLRSTIREVWKEGNGDALLKGSRALHSALTNISAQGPDAVSAHKDAFLQLERVFKGGGVPTDNETKLLLDHMGGIQGFLQAMAARSTTGDFPEIVKQNLARAATLAHQENEEGINNLMASMADEVGPGSVYGTYGAQVNKMIQARAKLFGRTVPSLYPEAEVTAELGSPRRPTPTAKKGSKGGGKSTDEWLKDL